MENQEAAQQQQPQGSRIWSTVQGLLFRAMIIYFITSFFRRPSTPPTPTVPGKAAQPSSNLFANGTIFVSKYNLQLLSKSKRDLLRIKFFINIDFSRNLL